MVKNKGKGGKYYKRSKNISNDDKRQLIFKEPGQEYAIVKKMLGNGRCDLYCFDGMDRIGHIRGNMMKKVWIVVDDIVLISLRDFQNEKADIFHKYTLEESKILQQYDEIDLKFKNDISTINQEDDHEFLEDIDFNDI